MKAQVLYDLREEYQFCSGAELHEFFEDMLGDPSPSGSANVPHDETASFVHNALDTIKHNSPGMANWVEDTRDRCMAAITTATNGTLEPA